MKSAFAVGLKELGKTAIDVLLKLINKENVKKLTTLQPELVVWQSTGVSSVRPAK
ncbi:hypothetical protein [Paenibacillus abyssi]|uniref:LacI family transcriptional regulator n=1 Tax=Paenibacillus abyssi TaxID=1340531 RepID=A0A917LEQ4_9BACL|nr:hypothetical protein [Paenibacillus abyssi]GGG16693.1 hypothetical protein GCM10010916_36930 [Paenibacillus abyssi]